MCLDLDKFCEGSIEPWKFESSSRVLTAFRKMMIQDLVEVKHQNSTNS